MFSGEGEDDMLGSDGLSIRRSLAMAKRNPSDVTLIMDGPSVGTSLVVFAEQRQNSQETVQKVFTGNGSKNLVIV